MTDEPLCIVAGAGPGVGLAVAKSFAQAGYRVALIARRKEALDAYVADIAAAGGVAAGFPADLSNPPLAQKAIQAIVSSHGPAHVLIYNAALWRQGPAMDLPLEAFEADLATGLTSAFAAVQAVYPGMKARGRGTILFTGGGLALKPDYGAGVAALTAAKSAIRGLTFALAKELEPDGIHVATVTIAGLVAPGTAFDPIKIASQYLDLHRQPKGNWDVERIFTGS